MEPWQKTILNPAPYTILTQLHQPQTTEQLAQKTGIKNIRTQEILKKMEKNKLIQKNTQGNTTKYSLKNNYDKIKQLRLDIEEHTTQEVENQVKKQNYEEARENIHINPPLKKKQKRVTIAKIEALQKIEKLKSKNREKLGKTRLHNLKEYIPAV